MSDILKIIERIVQGRSSFTILFSLTLIFLTVVAFRFEDLAKVASEYVAAKPAPSKAAPPGAEAPAKPAARADATPAAPPRSDPSSSPGTNSPAREDTSPAGSAAGAGCLFLPRRPDQSIDVVPGAILCDDASRERASVQDIHPDFLSFVRDDRTVARCSTRPDRTCSVWPGAPILRVSMKSGGSNPTGRLFFSER